MVTIVQQDTQRIIEDTFNGFWFTLESILDHIHEQYPLEDEFTARQLEQFCQNVHVLTYSRGYRTWSVPGVFEQTFWPMHDYGAFENVPSSFQNLDQQHPDSYRTLAIGDTQHLPIPHSDDLLLQDAGYENLMLLFETTHEDLARIRDVQQTATSQNPHQAHTASLANDSAREYLAPVRDTEEVRVKLERLTFSVKSSGYLWQLRTTIIALRCVGGLELACRTEDMVRILEQLEENNVAHAFKHRLLLFHLTCIRDTTTKEIITKKASGAVMKPGARKVEDQVLDVLVETLHRVTRHDERSFPLRSWRLKFKVERKNVKNTLSSARIWKSLVKEFGIGILIVVPLSDVNGSLNHRYQSTNNPDQKMLCCLMRQQEDGIIKEVADILTPFVRSILEGRQPPCLRIESEDMIPAEIDRLAIFSLLQESSF